MFILRRFKKDVPVKLGRWGTGQNMDILVKKAQQATDDHCGSDLCIRNFEKKEIKKDIKKDIKKEFKMDPLLPYVM